MQTRPSLIFVSLGHFSLLSSHSNPSQDHCRPSSTFAVVLRSLRDLFREARATKKTLFAAFRVFLRPSLVAAEPPCSARPKNDSSKHFNPLTSTADIFFVLALQAHTHT